MNKEQLEKEINRLNLTDIAKTIDPTIRSKIELALDDIITTSPELIILKQKVLKLAKSSIPILIIGDTGTGKELFAKALHGERQGKLISVNCAGIPDSLLESEFFGVKRGAFTGANEDRKGYLEEADNGTIFLDEIGDMPLLLQAKLLRVIEYKKFQRIGEAGHQRTTNCRFVAATNRWLDQVENRKFYNFRDDLYYRLAGFTIKLPPLGLRPDEDFKLLAKKYAINQEVYENFINTFTKNDFPGNVRELINAITAMNILLLD